MKFLVSSVYERWFYVFNLTLLPPILNLSESGSTNVLIQFGSRIHNTAWETQSHYAVIKETFFYDQDCYDVTTKIKLVSWWKYLSEKEHVKLLLRVDSDSHSVKVKTDKRKWHIRAHTEIRIFFSKGLSQRGKKKKLKSGSCIDNSSGQKSEIKIKSQLRLEYWIIDKV